MSESAPISPDGRRGLFELIAGVLVVIPLAALLTVVPALDPITKVFCLLSGVAVGAGQWVDAKIRTLRDTS